MRRTSIALCILSFLCLFIGGAFWGFEQIALDSGVYDRIQAELDIYDYVGISSEALPRVTEVLAGYLRGERADIDIEEEVYGVRQQVFNEDEKAHMIDVVGLFRLERNIRVICLAAGAALLLITLVLARGQAGRIAVTAAKGFLLLILAAATVLVWLYTTNGFDQLFILFHQLLFTNELWLMDPRTDAMIRMFPTQFFMQIALESGVSALVYGLAFTAAAWLIPTAAGPILNHPRRKQTP